MHKIYSRPRIKIPKFNIKGIPAEELKKRKKIVEIVIILIIAFSVAKLILDAVLPIFNELCKNRAKSIATMISNEQATIVMSEHTYDELFSIEKYNNGNIVMIKANVIPINEIISDVANKIQEQIDKRGRENVEIAIRKFYWFEIISRKRTRS